MTKVYFKPIKSYKNTKQISEAASELLKTIQKEEKALDFTKPLPIKVHFGEDKCTTYIAPKNYEGIIKYLKKEIK